MKEIVGVGFVHGGKSYYFDPQGEKYQAGDMVIVETARGMELGHIVAENREIEDSQVVAPLKPIKRRATDADLAHYKENYAKRGEAMKVCQERIQAHHLDMKLIDAEYTIDGSKVIFYFSSENRVDFRELVKDLAAHFRMRIELRQIGVRDEAKMLGGIGICGRPFCCSSWLSDFQPVSIKMAKQQNLSLNPAKISGSCGRLMCCLNYENSTYAELRKGMPNEGQRMKIGDGMVKVISVDLLRGNVVTRAITKDPETGEETLSTETRTYTKEELKGSAPGGCGHCQRGQDFEMAYEGAAANGNWDDPAVSDDVFVGDPEDTEDAEVFAGAGTAPSGEEVRQEKREKRSGRSSIKRGNKSGGRGRRRKPKGDGRDEGQKDQAGNGGNGGNGDPSGKSQSRRRPKNGNGSKNGQRPGHQNGHKPEHKNGQKNGRAGHTGHEPSGSGQNGSSRNGNGQGGNSGSGDGN